MNALATSVFTHSWWDDAVTQAITMGRDSEIKHRVTQDRETGWWQVSPVERPSLTLVLGDPIPGTLPGRIQFYESLASVPVPVRDADVEGVARACGLLAEPCS